MSKKTYTKEEEELLSKLEENGLLMFKNLLKKRKNSPIIHYYDSTLTVNDLDIQSSTLATAIRHETDKRQLKLSKGDRIALYCQNTPVHLPGTFKTQI